MKIAVTSRALSWIILSVFILALAMPLIGADDATKSGVYTGTLQAINLTGQTITVKAQERSKTFRVGENTVISTLEKKDKSTLKDLRSGFTVEVAYAGSGSDAQASSIAEIKAPAEK